MAGITIDKVLSGSGDNYGKLIYTKYPKECDLYTSVNAQRSDIYHSGESTHDLYDDNVFLHHIYDDQS